MAIDIGRETSAAKGPPREGKKTIDGVGGGSGGRRAVGEGEEGSEEDGEGRKSKVGEGEEDADRRWGPCQAGKVLSTW